jgi:hypothetical protein
MNVVDENIVFGQRGRLTALGVHYRQIGYEIGQRGMKDLNDVIPLLHSLRRPTFFTRDQDYYHPDLRHASYCLVYLDVLPDEAATFIHRLLRHPAFRTQAARMGKVIRVHPGGLNYWQSGEARERKLGW